MPGAAGTDGAGTMVVDLPTAVTFWLLYAMRVTDRLLYPSHVRPSSRYPPSGAAAGGASGLPHEHMARGTPAEST